MVRGGLGRRGRDGERGRRQASSSTLNTATVRVKERKSEEGGCNGGEERFLRQGEQEQEERRKPRTRGRP